MNSFHGIIQKAIDLIAYIDIITRNNNTLSSIEERFKRESTFSKIPLENIIIHNCLTWNIIIIIITYFME